VSTLRRELTAVLGDRARVERLLESRSLAREMDEIARRAQDVPPLSSMVPLTRAQREVADDLQAFLRRYVTKHWRKESFIARSPDELHPLELLVYYDEASRLAVSISVLDSAIMSSLQHDDPEYMRSPLTERLRYLDEYEPLKLLKEMRELVALWIPLATYVVSQRVTTFEESQAMLKQWEATSSTQIGRIVARLVRSLRAQK
jgi:hypothetical protein